MIKNNSLFLRLLSILGIIFFLSACSGKDQTLSSRHIPPPSIDKDTRPLYSNPSLSEKRKIIVQQAISALGATYKWGGQSPQTGFDCSGLVLYTHTRAGISPPRMAKDQFRQSKNIALSHIKPADLLFFKFPNSYKSLHVGIYIGDGLFVHAPGKGRQVTYVKVSNPYFKKHFLGARTFL